jgi:phosphoribosylformylglycinamidine synthase
VSGNVSLYNETKNDDGTSTAILPTPAIGGVGLLEDWEKSARIVFKAEGESVFLLGQCTGHIGQSTWRDVIHARRDGPPPAVDLDQEKQLGTAIRDLIARGIVIAVHDVSDGGLLVALAEMALAGGVGVDLIEPPADAANGSGTAWYFGEDQGRYLVTTSHEYRLSKALAMLPIDYRKVGTVGGNTVLGVPLADLRAAHESFFPKLMGSELTPEF